MINLSLPCPFYVWGPPGLLAVGFCCWVIWGLRSLNAAFPCWSCLSYCIKVSINLCFKVWTNVFALIFNGSSYIYPKQLEYKLFLGASVAERLRSLTSNHLSLTAVGSNPDRDFASYVWGSYQASLRNVGGFTQVPVPAWNNAGKGTWGIALEVFLHQ
jgi:hypothetical protein